MVLRLMMKNTMRGCARLLLSVEDILFPLGEERTPSCIRHNIAYDQPLPKFQWTAVCSVKYMGAIIPVSLHVAVSQDFTSCPYLRVILVGHLQHNNGEERGIDACLLVPRCAKQEPIYDISQILRWY